MRTITDELLTELKNTDDIKSFLDSHSNEFISETVSSYLNFMVSKLNLSIAEIAQASGVGGYTYKIFSGERKPSRDIAIAIALGMSLSIEETQLFLRIAKFAILDSRDKRDSIIIYGFANHMSIPEIDDMLDNNNLVTIN